MITIGLTGSIAMGKSAVAQIFEADGIPVFDSDAEVHSLYESPQGARLLETIAPEAVEGQKVNRKILSRLVLDNPAILGQIETVVHAEIAKRREEFRKRAEVQGQGIVAFDIPLLFEKSMQSTVDVIVVVSAPEQLQRQRALARSGMTPEKLDMILQRQLPDVEKRQKADYVIENDGDLAELRQRSLAVLAQIRKEHSL